VIPGALVERDPNFTPVKIYRKRINVSEINPFPNLPERIGGLEEWLMWITSDRFIYSIKQDRIRNGPAFLFIFHSSMI